MPPPTGSPQTPSDPLETLATRASIWSSIAGTVSFVNDVLELVNKANRTINEFRHFDKASTSLLVQFSREIALLEVWSQSLGFELDSNGQFNMVDSATFVRQSPTRARQLAALKLTFHIITGLLDKLVNAFEAMGNPTLDKVQRFLEHLHTPLSGSAAGPGSARTLGSRARTPEDALLEEMKHAGIINGPDPRWSKKLLQIIIEKQPQILELIQELSKQNGLLSNFVLDRKLDALDTLPACLAGVTDIRDKQTMVGTNVKAVQTEVSAIISKFELLRQGAEPQDYALNRAATRVIYALQGYFDIPGAELPGKKIQELELRFEVEAAFAQKRQVVLYNGAQHLVDWNEDLVIESRDEESDVCKRLGELTRALTFDPTNLRILKTAGYVEATNGSEKQYGILYRLPQDYDPKSPSHCIRTMKQLFPMPSKCSCNCRNCRSCQLPVSANHIQIPKLGERLQLVVTLLRAFREFQASQWLHQGISSTNIIFVCNSDTPVLSNPWIVGFDFARFVKSGSDRRKVGAFNDYQHPLRRQQKDDGRGQQRYRAEFELYSIGRLMIEIALWEEIKEEQLPEAVASMPEFYGDRFTDATKWCLGLSDDSPMREENIRSSAPPSFGAWSEILIRKFDFEVLFKVSDCQT